MMEKSKEERYETFINWTSFTEDRINNWKKILPDEISSKLDLTPESLNILESHLLCNYGIDDLKDNEKRPALDAIISYVGDLFRKNIPETYWKIDIEDETNIFYNLPYLVFKLGVPLSPHNLVQDALVANSGTTMQERYQQRYRKWQQYEAYMNTKKLS